MIPPIARRLGAGLAAPLCLLAVSACLLAISAYLTGCSDAGGPSVVEGESDLRPGEFQEVCRKLRESDEFYYGERTMRRLEAWLESPAAERTRSTDPTAVARAEIALAGELLERGETSRALALAEAAALGAPMPAPIAEPSSTPPHAAGDEARLSGAAIVPATSGGGSTGDPDLAIRRLATARNAHLQAAEEANCVEHHSAASCILPFAAEALHMDPAHARAAGDLSLEILRHRPDALSARWILNLTRMVTGDYPEGVPAELRLPEHAFESGSDLPLWRDRSLELGIHVPDLAGGAVMDDFDGDGYLDLVSSTADPCDSLKAFRNDGTGGFDDVTDAWGLRDQLGGLNLVHADYDNDGRLDLLVLRGGWLGNQGEIRNSLLRNQLDASGAGGFVDVTRRAGLAAPPVPSQTAAFGDYDLDGDLDLYVGNEAWQELAYPSQLFRNEGDGTFTDVALEAGVRNDRYTKGVAWGDFDDDGDPDLYVSNIGYNRLYRNRGDGTFEDVATELAVYSPLRRSFATWFFDYNNDGRLDLFVADYDAFAEDMMASYFGPLSSLGAGRLNKHPLLYRNEGGNFKEVSAGLGIARPMLPMGANYGDIDSDGWLDLYLGTGNPRFEALVPNIMLRNVEGHYFADVSFAGGVAHLQKGHGVAFGDIDNDGDQDLFHQLGGFFPTDTYGNALFENPGNAHAWIVLRFEGVRSNHFGVGARVEVRVGIGDKTRSLHRLVGSGGSFGGSSHQLEIGLGDAERIEEIVVRWPGGGVQRFGEVPARHIYRVVEDEPDLTPLPAARVALGG